jgi:hypothetical protein
MFEIFFHKFGKKVKTQKSIKITPENIFQTIGSISIKTVLALSKRENTKTEKESEAMII